VDGLLAAGIRPLATVFHWDAPTWLQRAGGLPDRGSVERLVEYGTALFRGLGDRVKDWITINEPSVFALGGYASGNFAPGRKRDLRGFFHSSHHMLLAHARLVDSFAPLVPGGRIGLAHHFVWTSPRDPQNDRDRAAASFMDDMANRFYLDAPFFGRYPESMIARLGRFLPREYDKDLPGMKRPGSFIGMNYYGEHVYRYARFQPYVRSAEVLDPAVPRTDNGVIRPEGMYRLLLRLRDEYGNIPCLITENGRPLEDEAGRDPLEDGERISYLADHIAAAGRAIAQGADCRGYFHWSLMDNFEWDKGFVPRWGLLRTDFSSQERTWKRSAFWYRDLIRANAIDSAAEAGAGRPSGEGKR
jgi:beta-glucosidase